jgi:hypothetical protein
MKMQIMFYDIWDIPPMPCIHLWLSVIETRLAVYAKRRRGFFTLLYIAKGWIFQGENKEDLSD